LKNKVKENFYNNPSLIYIKSSEHAIVDPSSGIEFNVKIMESLNSKPEGEKTKFQGQPDKPQHQ
jgi:hypothetical protein